MTDMHPRPRRLSSRRGGLLLDAVLSVGVVLVGAYLLAAAGITLPILLEGFRHFVGA